MTAKERLQAYLLLRANGYGAREANQIIEEIKEKMEEAE